MQTRLPNGQIVYQEDYSCIVDPQNGKGGIFIGNLEAAQNLKTLKKHGIRAILTAAKGIDLSHPKSQIPFYLIIPGQDKDGFDMTRFFVQGVNFIRDALENTSIMVHCLAGVSRSVCLVLAYFIKCKGFSYDEAYNLVKMKRSIIHPNQGFISQLKKYEIQVRSNNTYTSPTKYQVMSPNKRRYDYLFECEQPRVNNPEYSKFQNTTTINASYGSPSKRGIVDSYVQPYESPSKKSFHQLVNQDYQSPNKKLYYSPAKIKAQKREPIQISTFIPSQNIQMRKIQSYKQQNNDISVSPRNQLRHISPERRRQINIEARGRSNSNLDSHNEVKGNVEQKRLFGNYDRLRHTSAMQLSEQLDSKIAAIRQKYSQYTKNQLSHSRRMTARQSEPRFSNNYMDENETGLSGGLGFKKITSEYQGINSKFNPRQYGIVSNNIGSRASIGGGLGLRRLNTLRQGY